MTMFQMGNPQPATAGTAITMHTLVKRVAGNKYSPCLDGEIAAGIANDTVEAGDGFGLMSTSSGGLGIPCMAGGAIADGARFGCKVSATDDLSKAVDEADLDVGDNILGEVVYGSSALAEDLDPTKPSLAVRFYAQPIVVVEAP